MVLPAFFRLKFLRRLSASFVLLVAVTVISISALLFAVFSAAAKEELARSSRAMLTQSAFAVSLLFAQASNAGEQLLTTPEVLGAMYEREVDPITEYRAILLFKSYLGVYPFIASIGFYNGKIDRGLNTKWASAAVDSGINAHIARAAAFTHSEYLPRSVEAPAGQSVNVISLVLYPNNQKKREYRPSALIVNISEEGLASILKGMSTAPDEELVLIDRQNRVLAANSAGMFSQAIGSTAIEARISAESAREGTFETSYRDAPSLVSFALTPSLEWRLVSIRPLRGLFPALTALRLWTLLITATILAIGIGLAMLTARSLYAPIRSLMTSNFGLLARGGAMLDELDIFASALRQVRGHCLRHLLLDTVPEEPMAAALLASFKLDIGESCCCIVVLKIDEAKELPLDGERVEHVNAGILEALRRAFPPEAPVEIYQSEDNETVVLARLESPARVDALFPLVRNAQVAFRAAESLTLSAGIGMPVQDLAEIPESFHSARQALDLRFKKGRESLTGYRDIDAVPDYQAYPAALEARILESISMNHGVDLEKYLDQFIEQLSSLGIENAISQVSELGIGIRRQFGPVIGKNPEWQAPDAWRQESLSDMSALLKAFAKSTVDALLEKNAGRRDELVERMKSFVRRNYQDPNLNLGLACCEVHLSREYAGRLFRGVSGSSFAQYLNFVRMEKARELLETSDLPVGAIAKSIGLGNATYLFTLFKKTYSTTPNQFRDELRLKRG